MATSPLSAKPVRTALSVASRIILTDSLDYLDRIFYLNHRLGVQSNVLVAARYAPVHTSDRSLKLSKETVFSALRAVVSEYPELGLFGVISPSKRKGHHNLSIASLHAIDLESCVEFIDEDVPTVDAELLERIHNEWDWTTNDVKPGQPWWRLMVLGGRDVIFVFHHLVCDGNFGATLHQQFLAALNNSNSMSKDRPVSHIVPLDPESSRLNPELDAFRFKNPPIIRTIFLMLYLMFIRFVYSRQLFFIDFSKPRPWLKDPLAIAEPHQRTISRVRNVRIPADKMAAIVSACRARGTTFTPLLMVTIAGTVAADHYPNAKIVQLRYASNQRETAPIKNIMTTGGGRMINFAGGIADYEWVGPIRTAFTRRSSSAGDKTADYRIDTEAAWSLIQQQGERMKSTMHDGGEDSRMWQEWRGGNLVGPSLEEVITQVWPSVGLNMNNSCQVSNIGVLRPLSSDETTNAKQRWKIEEVQFSAGVIHGGLGYHGIVFNVAGLAGGDTMINVVTEDKMVPDGLVEAVLEGMFSRIDALM